MISTWAGHKLSLGGEYLHLSAPAQAAATTVRNEFSTNGWNPDLDAVVWDDTIVLSSSANLRSWLIGTAGIEGQPNRNDTRNQKVLLTATGTWTYANRAIMEARGGNWKDNGKVCLVEPQAASGYLEWTSRLQVTGTRGIVFRRITFGSDVSYSTPGILNYAPATLKSVTISAAGTGYAVNDALTFTGTYDTAPTATVSEVGASGEITGINVSYGGKYVRDVSSTNNSLITGVGVTSAAGTGATLTAVLEGANPRDGQNVLVQRTASYPLLSIVNFKDCKFGSEFLATPVTDPLKYMTALEGNNIEQLYVEDCQFKGYQTGIKAITVRHFKRHRCDFQKGIGDATIALNTGVTLSVGGITWNVVYPDLTMFTWSRLNTFRNLIDASALTNSQSEDMRFDQEHTNPLQHGTSGDSGHYKSLLQYDAVYAQRTTYQDRNGAFRNNTAATTRVNGGADGFYMDDSPAAYNIDIVVHDSFVCGNTISQITAYNGTSYLEHVSTPRCAQLPVSAVNPPDSFNYNVDPNTGFFGAKNGSGAASSINLRNLITGAITLDTGDNAPTITSNTGYVQHDARKTAAVGQRYQDIYAGTFTTDGEGRMTYDDAPITGAATPAAFRTALWAQFAPKADYASSGARDPALWPTT